MQTEPATQLHSGTVAAGPITAGERVLAVDVLRGFAIFGILLVNMAYFSAPLQVTMMETRWWLSPIDQFATGLIATLAEGKFYLLFSLLFGLGMAIQMERVEARGGRFAWLYVRRLVVLLGIGLLHAYLLWYGDILVTYALLGFPLLLFRKVREKTLLIVAVIVYALPWLVIVGLIALVQLAQLIPEARDEIAKQMAAQEAEMVALAHESVAAYGSGTVAEIFVQRSVDNRQMLIATGFMVPIVMAMFLLGVYVGRRRILHAPATHGRLLGWLAWWGLPIGLLCNVGYAVGMSMAGRATLSVALGVAFTLQMIGAPLLSFGYVAWILRAVQDERWRSRLLPLGAVGRMALTNYVLQTIVCTTIFYSYGFGLYNQVGPAGGLGLTLLIFVAQIPLSVWWLRRFRFGPLEWLWRTLTYGRWQPMLRAATV